MIKGFWSETGAQMVDKKNAGNIIMLEYNKHIQYF